MTRWTTRPTRLWMAALMAAVLALMPVAAAWASGVLAAAAATQPTMPPCPAMGAGEQQPSHGQHAVRHPGPSSLACCHVLVPGMVPAPTAVTGEREPRRVERLLSDRSEPDRGPQPPERPPRGRG